MGVSDPQSATPTDTGSDKQAQDLQAAFQQEQNAINGHLQYTAVNAEATRHDPLAARRDAMFTAYQSVLPKIDRKDPSKAQAAIDRVLGDVRALSGEVATFRQQAEKSKTDWDSRQGIYDDAVHQIEELEAWEDPKSQALRGLIDAIRTQVNLRQYAKATGVLDQLLPKLKLVYEECLRQKEAKERYDPAYEALKPRVEKVGTCMHVKLAAERDEIGTVQRDMEANTQAKKYVDALAQLEDLTTKLGTFETALADLEQRKQEFEDAWKALQEKLGQAEQSTYNKLVTDQQAITAGKPSIDSAAQAEEFDQAMSMLEDLRAKVDAFLAARDKLDDEKKAYDAAWAEVQSRLDQMAQSQFKKVEPLREGINQKKGEIDTAVQNEDYAGAVPLVQGLSTQIDEFQKSVEQAEMEKKAYEEAWGALQPKLTQTEQSTYQKLAVEKQGLADGRAAMDAAVQEEDFVKAKQAVDDLSTKADDYLAAVAKIDEQKKAYEAARSDLEKKSPGPVAPHVKLDAMTKDMDSVRQDMENFAKDEGFEQALKSVNDLSTKMDTFNSELKKLEEEKAAFDAAYDEPFQKRLAKVDQSTTVDMAPMQKSSLEMKGRIDEAAASEDYIQATSLVGNLKSSLDTFESADATQMYVVDYKDKKYSVTAKERAELMLKLSLAGVKETLDPLKHKAEAHAGRYNDLKSLSETSSGYVIYAVIYTLSAGKASLEPVATAVAGQQTALDHLANAISSDPADAQAACDAAVAAINATGKAISDYMDALESGGGRTIVALEVVAAVSFTIAAALGGAALVEAGVIASAVGANAAAGAGFGALESIANTALAPAAWGDADKINPIEVVSKAALAAVVSGGASALGTTAGGGAAKVVERLMLEKGFKTVGMRLVIKDMVENGLNSAIISAVQKTPDLVSGKTTWEKFWEAIAVGFLTGAAIGPALGKLKRNSPLFQSLKDEEIDAAFKEAKPDFVTNATDKEIDAAVNTAGKSGQGLQLPGKNPSTGEGLQKVTVKSSPNAGIGPDEKASKIGHHENMDFKGIKDAPDGKAQARHHSENPNAPPGSHSRDNPSTQINSGKKYRLPDGSYKTLKDMSDEERAAAHMK